MWGVITCFFFKQKTAYEMRISDWSSDVCSSDLQINVGNDSYNDGDKLKQYAAAQGQLSSALSRLLVVSENYPQLKADGLFRDLQAQLEGTENRITVARNRYIQAVQQYNTTRSEERRVGKERVSTGHTRGA